MLVGGGAHWRAGAWLHYIAVQSGIFSLSDTVDSAQKLRRNRGQAVVCGAAIRPERAINAMGSPPHGRARHRCPEWQLDH
jgi:hypothetical protein